MKNSIWNRALSMLLAVVLVVGLMPTAAFAAPAEETTLAVGSAAELPAEIPAGTTCKLTANITLEPGQQITALAGVLDGQGHTITVAGQPLAKTVTGTIQNLGLASTVPIVGEMFGPSFGSMAVVLQGGTIRNSYSVADVTDKLNDAGGLVGVSQGGTIRNSYYGGQLSGSMYGGLIGTSIDANAPSTIIEGYYTGGSSPVSMGTSYNKADSRFGKKTAEEMQTAAFAALLNTDIQDTGFSWAAVPGAMPQLVAGGAIDPGEKPGVSTADLKAAIARAEGLNEADYTPESWQAMQTALEAARAALAREDLTQDEADAAESALRQAIDQLKKPRVTQPVPLPSEGVIEITSADQLNWIMDPAETAGKYYRLANDITISGFWVSNMAGVFDGNGHTVTIEAASSLFDYVTETGVIQNVNFVGKSDQEIAAAANVLKGSIVNCRSEFTSKGAGLVTSMQGGIIANSLVVGNPEKGALTQKYTSGQVMHTWWPEFLKNDLPAEALIDSGAKPVKELKTLAMRDALNAGKGENGTAWGQGSDGYPYFGEDKHYVPEGEFENLYPVSFTPVNADQPAPVEGALVVSPDWTDVNLVAGSFQLEGVPETSAITWDCDDQNNGRLLAIDRRAGRLFVYGKGAAVVTATERMADGTTRKVAEISVSSVEKEIEALHLFIDGKDVTGGKHTVAGSEDGNIQVKVQYAGETQLTPVNSTRFRFVPESTELIHNIETSGIFRFNKPGTTTMTVTARNGKTAQVELTSTYVPVTAITPSVGGTNVLHGKNSMYPNYNTLETQVIIAPENASYQSGYTVTSSNEEIAFFSSSLPLGYVPCKDGTVTFTAKIVNVDPVTGEETVVTGDSTATFVYLNPLTGVTGPEKVHLKAYEEPQLLDLAFTSKRTDGYAVTETRLDWTFSGDGKVKITYPNKVQQIRDVNKPDHGNWVSSTEYFVQGLKAGTVVATGTPVDQSGGAKPVVITFEVEAGQAPPAFDAAQFIADGRATAANLLVKELSYQYGDEWQIYALLRTGETLPKAELDKYYASVAETVKGWTTHQKPTDIARVALALSVMDKDITNVDGVDLAAMLYNHPALEIGSNELTWALIALDARNTEIPADAKWSRQQMIDALLKFQNADGGIALSMGGSSGIDTTAMTVQALAAYPEQKAAVDKGMAYLKKAQTADFDVGNSEAISQTILTLSVLGRDALTDPEFTSDEDNMIHALSLYFAEGEGFRHEKNQKVNSMATVQAMQALDSYQRMKEGKTGYWTLIETQAPVDPEKPVYAFTSGENQKIVQGSLPETLTLTVDGPRSKLTGVSVDGIALNTADYAVSGNVTITLHKRYLETLSAAAHQVTVSFTDGAVSTRLFVEKAPAKPDPSTDITVSFTLYGDAHHGTSTKHTFHQNASQLPVWASATVTVAQDATVLTVLEKVLTSAGISWVNRGGYIATVNGLSEFDNGPLSGWMYMLNGSYPNLGVAQQTLHNGDSIIFHYTDDYTLENPYTDPAVADVEAKIDAIGTVTKASAQRITAARKAYDALTSAQKAQVSNYSKLTAAELALAKLQATDTDKEAAQKVQDKISAIGTVTAASGNAIAEARKAYDGLTELQQLLVENYDILLTAEKKFDSLADTASCWDLYRTVGESLQALAEKNVPQVGSVSGEWLIIGLARSGRAVPAGYYDNVVQFVTENINENEQLHRNKSTENSRVILALTAIGKSVTDVAGHNLLMGLTDMEYLQRQGINGPIWALIALDSGKYEIPANPSAAQPVTRETLLDTILQAQLPDGGWALSGKNSETDLTGMALQALAPYADENEAVSAAVEKALSWLSRVQAEDGSFHSMDGSSVESTTQVIVALTALGIDPHTDARFVKNGISLVDALSAFAVDDGFCHVAGGKRDQMATEQGYYALAAYDRFVSGKTSLYDMTDVSAEHTHAYRWVITQMPSAETSGTAVGICDCGDFIQKQLPAGIKVTVEAGADNQLEAALLDDLIRQVALTDAEIEAVVNGAALTLTYAVQDMSGTVTAEQKAALQAADKADALFLRLAVTKQVEGMEPAAVSKLEEMVLFNLVLPEGYHGQEVYVSDGEQKLLGYCDSETGALRMSIGNDSIFAILPAEAQTAASEGTAAPMVLAVSGIVLLLVLAAFYLYRKKNQQK